MHSPSNIHLPPPPFTLSRYDDERVDTGAEAEGIVYLNPIIREEAVSMIYMEKNKVILGLAD